MQNQPKKSSNGVLWVVAIGGLIAAAYIAPHVPSFPGAKTATTPKPSPSIASSPAPQLEPLEPKCVKAAGLIWTGVRLYRSSSCSNSYAYIFGGNSKRLFVSFDDGTTGWIDRSDAISLYVLDNDPGIAQQNWVEMKQ